MEKYAAMNESPPSVDILQSSFTLLATKNRNLRPLVVLLFFRYFSKYYLLSFAIIINGKFICLDKDRFSCVVDISKKWQINSHISLRCRTDAETMDSH